MVIGNLIMALYFRLFNNSTGINILVWGAKLPVS